MTWKSMQQYLKEELSKSESSSEGDNIVVSPSHYERYAIEPITFIMENDLSFWRGNIIKYAMRAGYKSYPEMDEVESEITDLCKVIRYAQMRINQLEGKPVNATR